MPPLVPLIITQRLCIILCILITGIGCTRPIDPIKELSSVAIVSATYTPSITRFTPELGENNAIIYAEFDGNQRHRSRHESLMNEFLQDISASIETKTDIAIVRPLKFLNTSLLSNNDAIIQYEYLLTPYDPIDINDTLFMAGLCKRLNVDAVAKISIRFSIFIDDTTIWDNQNNPHAKQLFSRRQELIEQAQPSLLRTTIQLTIVDAMANVILNESRFVDSQSDQITIDDGDLTFAGGISPKLLALGLEQWVKDFSNYLSE